MILRRRKYNLNFLINTFLVRNALRVYFVLIMFSIEDDNKSLQNAGLSNSRS